MNIATPTDNRMRAIATSTKGRIATLMADGRQRTFDDICIALKATKKDQRIDINSALRSLKSMEILVSEKYERNTVVWVKR